VITVPGLPLILLVSKRSVTESLSMSRLCDFATLNWRHACGADIMHKPTAMHMRELSQHADFTICEAVHD
jgi:hypothetical protein